MASQRKVGVVLGYANIVVKNIVNLVYTPMLLSFVGQANYGVFQTANSFIFSLSLITFGFSEAYLRFYMRARAAGEERDIRRLNGLYIVLYAVICAVALCLGLVIASNVSLFFSGNFTVEQVGLAGQLMSIMAVNVTITLFSTVFDAYIVAHEQFRFQQTRSMCTSIATPFLALALLSMGFGVVGVAMAQLVVNGALLVLNARFAVVKLRMGFEFRNFDWALFRAVAAFSGWIFANQVCELINQSVPNILLGALSGAAAVAVFAVSVQIRQVFYSLSTTMSGVFSPLINRIVAESDDNVALTSLMARVGRYQAMLFCYVLGGFALLGDFFVRRWAGEGFADAYWLVLIMVVPLIIPLTQNTGIEIQRAKNRHKARSVAYLCMAVINLAVTAALAGPLGYWAPVIGYVAYVVLGCGVFMNWYYQRHIGLDMLGFWRRVLPVAGFAVVVTGFCLIGRHFLPVCDWFAFFAWGVVYSVVFVLAAWKLLLDPEEREKLALRFPRVARMSK